jgi:hypothetical protein
MGPTLMPTPVRITAARRQDSTEAPKPTTQGVGLRRPAAVPYPTPDRDADGYSEVDCRASDHGRTPFQVGSECCKARHDRDKRAALDPLVETYAAGCTSTGLRTGSRESGRGSNASRRLPPTIDDGNAPKAAAADRPAPDRLPAHWRPPVEQLAAVLQGIENRVHHVRDVTHGEDASRIRTGTGPQLMAALRNTDLNLARLRGETNVAASQRRNAWTGSTAADTVGSSSMTRTRAMPTD